MNNYNPEISIIVPNYNYEKYIFYALSSIQAQTFKNWECIVIDDGSLDDSVRIIEKFVRTDSRFKLIQKKHTGISVARNAGLDAARGEYIAFLDADDCYAENALETLLHLAKSNDSDMAGGATLEVNDFFKYIPSTKYKPISNDAFFTCSNPSILLSLDKNHKFCWIWRRIYKRSLIGDTRFIPELTIMDEDSAFMLSIAWRAKRSTETESIVVYHRIHQKAATVNTISLDKIVWLVPYIKCACAVYSKYDYNFNRLLWNDTFGVLLKYTLFIPYRQHMFQQEGKQVLIECCKLIPRRYLTWRQRILCRFISCLK